MAVPKSKVSKSRRGMRRSHDSIGSANVSFDKVTGAPKLPHHISADGMYNGRKVFVEAKVDNQNSAEEAKKEDTEENKEE
jgi:large subunit ribosomal protein L32